MRLRIRFSKLGKIRWTSHRDTARMWERAFRRVQLRLAYTQGFSPRPKVSFGLALPTGAESAAEYLDIELDEAVEVADQSLDAGLGLRLTAALPAGLEVQGLAVLEPGMPSLQESVVSCSWTVELGGCDAAALADRLAAALAADSLVISRERKGKASDDDVRPGILSCTANGLTLEAELAAHPRTLRPSELVAALDPDLEIVTVRRTHQWIECDGAKREPLPLVATAAPHALEVRAS